MLDCDRKGHTNGTVPFATDRRIYGHTYDADKLQLNSLLAKT